MRIERLAPGDVSPADPAGLGSLLVDCVDGGASVGFLRPLDQRDAVRWWRQAVTSPGSVTWIAREGKSVLGTVQLHKAGQPNGPHRAEVAKLLVRREARGRGCAAALMETLENPLTLKSTGETPISRP